MLTTINDTLAFYAILIWPSARESRARRIDTVHAEALNERAPLLRDLNEELSYLA